MGALKEFLSNLLYKLGLRKRPYADEPVAGAFETGEPTKQPQGFDGPLHAETALILEDNRVVLAVGYDFQDVPSWVEVDAKTRGMNIVQMGGSVATVPIQLPMAPEGPDTLKDLKRIALVTGTKTPRLVQYIAFIFRS